MNRFEISLEPPRISEPASLRILREAIESTMPEEIQRGLKKVRQALKPPFPTVQIKVHQEGEGSDMTDSKVVFHISGSQVGVINAGKIEEVGSIEVSLDNKLGEIGLNDSQV